MQKKNQIQLTVNKGNQTWTANFEKGSNLLQSLYSMGFYEIANNCGGRGICKRCRVITKQKGEVISCLTRLDENLTVELFEKDKTLLRDDTLIIKSNSLSSEDQAKIELAKINSQTDLGLAIDIGTTTIVVEIFNLENFAWLGEEKERNKQNGYGSDVISRIAFSNDNGVQILSEILQKQLNQMIDSLSQKLHINKKQIIRCSIAGNTVMEHFLMGLSPQTIGVAPFRPLSFFGEIYNPKQINFNLEESTEVYIFPAIAGYVGGDITAGILTTKMHQSNELSFLLDIGTNGEMVLGSKERLISCATAAGPAFEGAEIEKGMLGVPGAIDKVFLNLQNENPFSFTTIGDLPPQGFCGSGLLDMLAVAVKAELVQDSGLISDKDEVSENVRQYLTEINNEKAIIIDKDNNVYITQKDVRKLQSVKGAIAAGLVTLLETTKTELEEIETFYIAGGFGSAINVDSLAVIGMIPASFVANTKVIGNSSLSGATMFLESRDTLKELEKIKKECQYIELSTDPNFTDHYIDAMFFDEF